MFRLDSIANIQFMCGWLSLAQTNSCSSKHVSVLKRWLTDGRHLMGTQLLFSLEPWNRHNQICLFLAIYSMMHMAKRSPGTYPNRLFIGRASSSQTLRQHQKFYHCIVVNMGHSTRKRMEATLTPPRQEDIERERERDGQDMSYPQTQWTCYENGQAFIVHGSIEIFIILGSEQKSGDIGLSIPLLSAEELRELFIKEREKERKKERYHCIVGEARALARMRP